MSDAFNTVPVRTDAGVTLNTDLVNSIPTGSNTIGNIGAINNALPAGSNSIGTVGLNAGNNLIGRVEVIETSGTVEHYSLETSSDVAGNGGQQTVNFAAVTSGQTAELRSATVSASVAMKAEVRSDNTLSPVVVATLYIPAGGGTVTKDFMNDAVSLAGTVAGEHFDVVFTNLDKVNAAEAHAALTWSEQ